MRTSAPWADLPSRYPPYQTCHRHFRAWLQTGVLAECLRRLAHELETVPHPGEEAGPHTWRENTALLLASPLGRRLLATNATPEASVARTDPP